MDNRQQNIRRDAQMPMNDGEGRPGMSSPRGMVDFDALAADGIISQETCDKIKAYMEENRPDDLPELPEMNDEAPAFGGREFRMGGRRPMMNGQTSQTGGEAAEGESPADLPEPPEKEGEMPEFDGEAPALDGENPLAEGLLKDLLEAEVITQAEYDALVAALGE